MSLMTTLPICKAARRGAALLLLGSLAGLSPGLTDAAQPTENVLASWRDGSLTAEDYEAWRVVHGVEDSADAVREMAYVMSMADASRRRGADRERRTVLELEAMRQAVLLPAFREALTADVEVTDADLEKLRQENPDALERPRRVKLRNIFKRLDPEDETARTATRERMAALRAQLVAGADFAELAKSESESQSRFRDGFLGWIRPDELPEALAALVSGLEPGEISEVVEHAGGLGIFLCEEIRAAQTKSFEDVRETWRGRMLKQRKTARWREASERLLEELHVKVEAGGETALTMDGYELASSDLEELFAMLRPKRAPGPPTPEESETVLRDWALGIAAVMRAEKAGLDERPELARALRWREVDVLAHRELVRRVDARFREPTVARLRELLADAGNARRLWKSDEYHLAMIHFGAAADQEDQESWIGEVVGVVRRIETGELPLAEAARRYSKLESAAAGGDEGWQPSDSLRQLGARFMSALRALKPGESSGLLRLESGLWFFELRGHRPARAMTFEEAEPQLRQLARSEQISALEQTIRDEQLEAIELVVADHPEIE